MALTHQAAAVVSMGTYSAWQSTATLRLLGSMQGAGAPTGEERGGGILCRHAHSLLNIKYILEIVTGIGRIVTAVIENKIKFITTCLAVIFVASRNIRVTGCTIILLVSTNTSCLVLNKGSG